MGSAHYCVDNMTDKDNKFFIGLLAMAIVVAIGVFAYYQLPQEKNSGCGGNVLTVTYQGEEWSYTLCDLQNLESYTGIGSMKTQRGIKDPHTYTGVRFAALLQEMDIDQASVAVNVTAADGYYQIFNQSVLRGDIEVYDQAGNITNASAEPVFIIAYQQNGEDIGEEDGPLRVACVGEENIITSSKYWVKQVVRIEVVSA